MLINENKETRKIASEHLQGFNLEEEKSFWGKL